MDEGVNVVPDLFTHSVSDRQKHTRFIFSLYIRFKETHTRIIFSHLSNSKKYTFNVVVFFFFFFLSFYIRPTEIRTRFMYPLKRTIDFFHYISAVNVLPDLFAHSVSG